MVGAPFALLQYVKISTSNALTCDIVSCFVIFPGLYLYLFKPPHTEDITPLGDISVGLCGLLFIFLLSCFSSQHDLKFLVCDHDGLETLLGDALNVRTNNNSNKNNNNLVFFHFDGLVQ